MSKINFSGFIICYNEDASIIRSLESLLKVCEEVVVVDSGSTDNTLELVNNLKNNFKNIRIFYKKFNNYSEQKEYAQSLCIYDWIVNIDADEILSNELIEEILKFKHNMPEEISGLSFGIVPCTSEYKKLPATYCEAIRIYDKRKYSYFAHNLHKDRVQEIVPNTKLKFIKLNNLVWHIQKSFDVVIIKNINYLLLKYKYSKKRKITTLDYIRLVLVFPLSFMRFYIAKCYFLYGLIGLRMSIYNSCLSVINVLLCIHFNKKK